MKKINKTIVITTIIICLSLLGFYILNKIKTIKKINLQEVKTNVLSKEKIFEFNQLCLDKKNKIHEELNSKIYTPPKDLEPIPHLKSRTIKEIFYSPVENSCMYTVNQVIEGGDLYGFKISWSELLIYKYGKEDIFKRFPSNYDEDIHDEITSSKQELELTKAVQILKSLE